MATVAVALMLFASIQVTASHDVSDAAGAHPPVRIVGELGFTLPGSGVTQGAGTDEDPYVIEGWTFLVRNPPESLFSVPSSSEEATIQIVGTASHVIIRNNVFLGLLPQETSARRVPVDGPPAISIASSSNVRIEQNAFHDVGGPRGAILVAPYSATAPFPGLVQDVDDALGAQMHDLQNIVIAGNEFEHGNRPTIYTNRADIQLVDNRINVSSHDCCFDYGVVKMWRPADGSRIAGNHITTNVGAGFGGGATAIEIIAGVLDEGTITIEDNRIDGWYGGISVGDSFAAWWEGGSARVLNNRIDTSPGWTCISAKLDSGLVSGNVMTGCDSFQADDILVDRTNTLNGGITWQVRADGPSVIDAAGESVAWLGLPQRVNEITLRNFHLPSFTRSYYLWEGKYTFENSTFPYTGSNAGFHFSTATDVTFRDSTLSSTGPWLERTPLSASSRTMLIERTHILGGNESLSVGYGATSLTVTDSVIEGARTHCLELHNRNGVALLTNVTFKNCPVGIDVSSAANATLVVRNSSFLNVTGVGIQSAAPDVVDARENWWGHATGPQSTTNPAGQGASVSTGVLVAPWRTSAPN